LSVFLFSQSKHKPCPSGSSDLWSRIPYRLSFSVATPLRGGQHGANLQWHELELLDFAAIRETDFLGPL